MVVRKLTRDIEKVEKSKFECPTCHHMAVKRQASGIWACRHCDAKFAAGSYAPTKRSITSKELTASNGKQTKEGGEKSDL